MNLVIRAQTLNDRPLSQAIVGCFDLKGGTIGRSDTNTMALPDPERHISRLQAEVSAQSGGFSIRNSGAANAIFINGRALAPGEGSLLTSGDELRIGGYALGVMVEAENEVVRTITQGRAVIDARAVIVGSAVENRTDPRHMGQGRKPLAAAPAPLGAPPAAAPLPAPAGLNPFSDLLAAPAASASAADDPFAFLGSPGAGPAPTPAPAAPSGAPARLPDDFDPFAGLLATPPPIRPAAAPMAPAGANDLLASVGANAGPALSLDASFGLGGASGASSADPLAAFMGGAASAPGAASPMAGAGSTSTDPFAMFGASPAARAPGPAAFNHTPELKGAYEPPPIVHETRPAVRQVAPAPIMAPSPVAAPAAVDPFAGLELGPASSSDPLAAFIAAAPPAAARVAAAAPVAAPARSAASAGHPPDALWAAFCEGAGVDVALPQGLSPEQMRMLGTTLRESVEGTLRLMAVRATAKTELRAAVTTIRARNNNPLKFSPSAEAALGQLLQPPLRGFMAGPVAMQDAMHDLVGHSIGTMAGMRAALAGVLARFEPGQLEAKLAGKSMLDSLMPGGRKAKLWDLYLQHFESIRNDAHDDFHNLFGAAFVAAYEEQLDQLPAPRG
ncbi:MAG: type VI secretion system-associated FHA domain protein TagH [Burkholderiales bacterium]|nr:type VI secretion system-associated FHA domain protein TagH [Burkholderiales bacterium]